jgi:dihydrofolate reductase
MKTALLCAISMDGFLNHISKSRVSFTSDTDRAWFRSKTKEVGVIIMGDTTYRYNFKQPMPGVLHYVLTHKPEDFEKHESVVFTDAEPAQILKDIEEKGHNEVIIGGGGMINSLFLRAGLLDEAYLTHTQYYFGEGVPLFAGAPSAEFELLDSRPMGLNEILAHYKVKK